jgi:hypothetical protein
MRSLFSSTNRLVVAMSVLAASASELLSIKVEFSEAVPNAEQASILEGLAKLQHDLVTEQGTNDVEGSLFNASNSGALSFQVLAEDGTVLESVNPVFAAGVPNEEATLVLARLASFAAGVVETAAPVEIAA